MLGTLHTFTSLMFITRNIGIIIPILQKRKHTWKGHMMCPGPHSQQGFRTRTAALPGLEMLACPSPQVAAWGRQWMCGGGF